MIACAGGCGTEAFSKKTAQMNGWFAYPSAGVHGADVFVCPRCERAIAERRANSSGIERFARPKSALRHVHVGTTAQITEDLKECWECERQAWQDATGCGTPQEAKAAKTVCPFPQDSKMVKHVDAEHLDAFRADAEKWRAHEKALAQKPAAALANLILGAYGPRQIAATNAMEPPVNIEAVRKTFQNAKVTGITVLKYGGEEDGPGIATRLRPDVVKHALVRCQRRHTMGTKGCGRCPTCRANLKP